MLRRAETSWTVGLLAALACGCSSSSGGPTSSRGHGTSTDPTTGSSGAGGSDRSGTTTGFGSGGGGGNDNPDVVAAFMKPDAGANAGTGGGSVDADGCVTGKFCQSVTPDNTDCGHLDLKTDTMTIDKPGNLMVIFDRSGSMEEDWNGTPKYMAAGNALLAAITPIKDLLTIGGLFFPSASATTMPADTNCPDGCDVANPIHWIPGPGACCLNDVAGVISCDVDTIDKPDEQDFVPAAQFIMNFPNLSVPPNATAGTPLEAGVMNAAAAIASHTFTDPLIVLIMTDGEPNCNSVTQNVIDQVTAWHTAGINTHVVGLPGAQGAADLLNQIATAGGTMSYIDPSDPMELETRLESVISSTVKKGFMTCTFNLDPKAEAPDKLHLIVTENGVDMDVARDLSKDATWTINADGSQVELMGQLCDFAKDGTFEMVRFQYGCVTTPPLPPPPEPMLN
jgi:hypothetical protein